MARLIFTRGKQVYLERASIGPSGGTGLQKLILSMSADDRSVAFTAADTTLVSPTNLFKANFDSTPARTNETMRHTMTIPAASFNGVTIRRLALHNEDQASVTGASATLVAGVDQLTIVKSADFSSKFHIDI